MPQPLISVLESGPVLLGCLGHWFLFGAFLVQFYDYFVTYHTRDRAFVKTVVYMVFLCGLAQTVIETYTIWALLISGWGIVEAFEKAPTLSAAVPALSGVVSATVQVFFAWRIWTLKQETRVARVVVIFIVIVSLVQCGGAVAVGVEFALADRNPNILHTIKAPFEVWLIGSFICDLAISATMLTLLVRARRASSFKSTAKMINRLIVITIETGTITVIIVCIQLVVYLEFPSDYIHLAMMYILLSVYSNVLLATLNGRERARQYANDVEFSINLVSHAGPPEGNPQNLNISMPKINRDDTERWLEAPPNRAKPTFDESSDPESMV